MIGLGAGYVLNMGVAFEPRVTPGYGVVNFDYTLLGRTRGGGLG